MKRYAFVLLILCLALTASGQSYRPSVELGTQVINPTVSTALTVPTGTAWIMFSVRTAGVHVSFDATAATTSDIYFAPGLYKLENDYQIIPLLRFLDSSDGASTVTVKYFKAR